MYAAPDNSILRRRFLFVLCQDGTVTYVNSGTEPYAASEPNGPAWSAALWFRPRFLLIWSTTAIVLASTGSKEADSCCPLVITPRLRYGEAL